MLFSPWSCIHTITIEFRLLTALVYSTYPKSSIIAFSLFLGSFQILNHQKSNTKSVNCPYRITNNPFFVGIRCSPDVKTVILWQSIRRHICAFIVNKERRQSDYPINRPNRKQFSIILLFATNGKINVIEICRTEEQHMLEAGTPTQVSVQKTKRRKKYRPMYTHNRSWSISLFRRWNELFVTFHDFAFHKLALDSIQIAFILCTAEFE